MTATTMAGPSFTPSAPSKYTPEVISMTTLRNRQFDHQRPLERMTPMERLEEYLYLQAEHGDEKDPLRGNTIYRPPHIHVRLMELERHILERLGH